ncbi:hypothetical protein K505DRAFT_394161 [Melanomma pulvis-pyrius CBS 109.77]|uniref:Uncharacterized protein n=1 Tax=Melanomma pulvis-pyrius CBS 109.77 TaxID=1314802 RepID=A0A6A6WX60_9PLEO|nr:hypothetical protein K505DRAFT_394161 [Melanomma pulvis-pyrius CBS 109.77]
MAFNPERTNEPEHQSKFDCGEQAIDTIPGIVYEMNSEQERAILGSKNEGGVRYTLFQHEKELGHKIVHPMARFDHVFCVEVLQTIVFLSPKHEPIAIMTDVALPLQKFGTLQYHFYIHDKCILSGYTSSTNRTCNTSKL